MSLAKARPSFQRIYSKHGWLIALSSLLLFAFFLRLINYTGVLDYDVLEYAYRAFDVSRGNFHLASGLRDVQFRYGLYVPLGFLYWLLDPSEFSTVLYCFLASIIGVVLVYAIGRLQAGESAGLIAALIWAALPLNVFLSTRFGPDPILASYTLGAVYFLLKGNQSTGTRAILYSGLGILLAIVGVFVKPSAVIVFVFIGLYFALKVLRGKWDFILTGYTRLNKKLFFAIGLAVILLVGFEYARHQNAPMLFSLYRASTDLSALLVLGKTQESLPVRGLIENTNLFLVAAPIFISSFVGLLMKRIKGATLPLIWAASQFLYFEWGSISTNPLTYSPFLAATNDRNTLFIVAPFAILAGICLAQLIKLNEARLVSMLALVLVVPIAWFYKQAQFSGGLNSFVAVAVVVSIMGSFLISRHLFQKAIQGRHVLVGGWLLVTLIGFLFPTPPLHVSESYWQRQTGYREVVTSAVQFFFEHPDYPILALSGANARELNFQSGFELGFSNYGVEQPGARIQVVDDPKSWTDSAYIYLRDEINQIRPVPSNWWKVAEYDAGTGRPVLIYRVLSVQDANREVAAAQNALREAQTLPDLERLLAAGVNARNTQAAVQAWEMLNQMVPGEYPVDLIAPMVVDNYHDNKLPLEDRDYLAAGDEDSLNSYQIDAPLEGLVSLGLTGDDQRLSISIQEDLGGKYGIYKQVKLAPNSLYVFVVKVRSNTGVDLLQVMGGEIPDSQNYSDVFADWTERVVIFITPPSPEYIYTRLDLLTVNKAGMVSIMSPRLYRAAIEIP